LERKNHIERLKNGWWFCHKTFNSKAKVAYGSVYNIPKELGPVDISTFGSILLHLRDPFAALQNASALTEETVIVTDVTPDQSVADLPAMLFCPDFRRADPYDSATWWILSPQVIIEFLGVLGFERTEVSYHTQRYQARDVGLYTVVGHRTRKRPPL
jgi:hypothetical protein